MREDLAQVFVDIQNVHEDILQICVFIIFLWQRTTSERTEAKAVLPCYSQDMECLQKFT